MNDSHYEKMSPLSVPWNTVKFSESKSNTTAMPTKAMMKSEERPLELNTQDVGCSKDMTQNMLTYFTERYTR